MLCASQASTPTICSPMDQTSQPSSSSGTIRLGGRAIDRHNPIIRDGHRLTPPPSPNPNISSSSSSTYHTPLKSRLGLESSDHKHSTKKKSKNHSPIGCFGSDTPQGSSRYLLSNPVLFDGFVDSEPISLPIELEITKADDLDQIHEDRLVINASRYLSSSFLEKKQSDFLEDVLEKKQPEFFDGFLDYEPVMSPDNPFSEPTKASPTPSQSSSDDKDVSSPDFNFSLPPPPPPPPLSPSSSLPQLNKNQSSDQVVVLKVSLHCKGCAAKVKKHLSKLKGVTSFNIDFAAKKVTVMGDVTPLTVLSSISKVKNAKFWPEIIQK